MATQYRYIGAKGSSYNRQTGKVKGPRLLVAVGVREVIVEIPLTGKDLGQILQVIRGIVEAS